VFEISVVSYQGNPPAQPISARFGRDGGTIGRGPANTLVLSDPNRFVSRVQARVVFDGARMTIANASTANPLLVNDRELEAGAKATLTDGDELRIGLYLLRIRQLAPASAESAGGSPTPASPAARRQEAPIPSGQPVQVRPRPLPAPNLASPDAARPTPDPGPIPNLAPSTAAAGLDAIPNLAPSTAPADLGGAPGRAAPSNTGRTPASLDPVDPLALQFGDSGADPFADLIANPRGEIPAAKPAAPVASMPPRSDNRAPVPAPKPASDAAAIPDSVWEDLVRTPPPGETSPPPPPVLPANFDPFAAPSSSARNAADPLAEFAQSGVALDSFDKLDTPVDKLFGDTPLQGSRADAVIPDPLANAPDPLASDDSLDPLAVFGDSEARMRVAADSAFSRSERDDVPELEAYFRPPAARFDEPAPGAEGPAEPNLTEIIPPRRAATPPAAHSSDAVPIGEARAAVARDAAAPSSIPDARRHDDPLPAAVFAQPPDREHVDRLLQELLLGAGIPHANLKEGLTPEMMRQIGAMLAAAVQGTIELIATRALLKREVKADVTIIASTRNNPLKFLPDAESALLQMFGNRIPGFMAPVEAMQDAFRDLRAHEVGLIAGMHAALTQVLRRFEPSELEKRLKPAGVLEGLLPNSHKARLWEEFAEMYVDISREAQDDFQSLFGKAFLQAYDTEVSRLKGH
jgi:FHA domain-containing protein